MRALGTFAQVIFGIADAWSHVDLAGQSKAGTKLVIRNGRVVDPKNGVDAVTDVSIDAGKVIAAGPIPEASMLIAKLR